jgi:hypothetical protein
MWALLVPKQLERFYSYLVFKSLSIQGWILVILNIPAPKTGTIQTGAKTQNSSFLKNGYYDFDEICVNSVNIR